MNIHLVLYLNNEPYNTTKAKIINSVKEYSSHNIIIHDYNLQKIKKSDWFYMIKDINEVNFRSY